MVTRKKLQNEKVAGSPVGAQHICGICEQGFFSDEEYLTHVCPNTNYQPQEIEHQDALTGGRFSQISNAALERGAKREEE